MQLKKNLTCTFYALLYEPHGVLENYTLYTTNIMKYRIDFNTDSYI